MIEYRALRSFVVLAEELHFGRSADRLRIAQSALSTHIRRLEDRLGSPLLSRGKRAPVRLTPTGETFLKEARAAIAQLDRAERIGILAGKGAAGQMRIAYIFSAAVSGLLGHVLAASHDRFPALRIEAEMMSTPEQLDALADGRTELAFGRPRTHYPDGIATCRVHQEDVILLVGTRHPLARRKSVTPSDLHAETFIVPRFDDGTGLIENQRRLAVAGGFPTVATLTVKDFITAACMAAGGYGVVLAPRSMMRLQLGETTAIELADYSDSVETIMAYRKDLPSPLAQAVAAKLAC